MDIPVRLRSCCRGSNTRSQPISGALRNPISKQLTSVGPVLPEPIVGKDAVIGFLDRVAPSLTVLETKQRFESPTGACAELVFQLGDMTLEEVHCLDIDQGQITAIRLYFDPRPLLNQ